MKVIIQIPCLNEEETLPEVLRDLPREIPGVDRVEWLIIDDGSTDRTVDVAREHGVDHVVRLPVNRGLAAAYLAGLDACVKLGADVVVNTDGDNQYFGGDVPALVQPILEGRADMVVGDRQVDRIPHFSRSKKALQKLGSWVIRLASETGVRDAPSGFRAITRELAERITLNNRFSYTLETIIQAGVSGRALASVPVRTNPKTRESRLFTGIPNYLKKSFAIIVRIYTMYRPLRAFFVLSLPFFLVAAVLGARWLYFWFTTPGPTGHVQSLIAAAIAAIIAVQILLFGLLGDLLATNRRLGEEVLYRVRELERVQLHGGEPTPPAESRDDAP
ncbi:MAG: glycosyltransferase family 2 protein [Myxococcota bacterium]